MTSLLEDKVDEVEDTVKQSGRRSHNPQINRTPFFKAVFVLFLALVKNERLLYGSNVLK